MLLRSIILVCTTLVIIGVSAVPVLPNTAQIVGSSHIMKENGVFKRQDNTVAGECGDGIPGNKLININVIDEPNLANSKFTQFNNANSKDRQLFYMVPCTSNVLYVEPAVSEKQDANAQVLTPLSFIKTK